MKKQLTLLFLIIVLRTMAYSQISSTNGTFTAAGTTNFSMRTNTAPRITILGSGTNIGFVGINTTTPAYNLDVNGNVNASSFLINGRPLWTTDGSNISYTGSVAGDVNLNLNALTTGNSILTLAANTGGTSIVRAIRSGGTASPLILQTNSLERLRIDENGNVGIGASSPDGVQINVPIGNENSNNTNNIRLGIIGGTPRILLDKAGSIPFEIDNAGGQLRIFNPGAVRLVVNSNGYVGIGTGTPDAALTVKGTIHTNEVKVDLNGAVAPDYVFEKDYQLMSLEETKTYIDANKHLPEVPSAREMEKNGLQLGEMNLLLLKKVEELTLHLIDQQTKIKEQEERIKTLEKKLDR